MNKISHDAFILCCLLLIATNFGYYSKWKQAQTEATLSWDVSGYYLYLPAAFIYKDLKQLAFFPEIQKKYNPGPEMGQAFKHPSGNYVLKYPMGQALQMLPWFTVAHLLAKPLGYDADGFSRPYQAAISWGSLLIAFLGLWYLRRILLLFFSDIAVAAALICIGFGSNYLEYTAITGAMTHNWLFTLYAVLIFTTIRFYERPSFAGAALIGLCVGWAGLTRPTEIITALIPVLWGLRSFADIRVRGLFFLKNASKLGLAICIAAAVLFLQALYWKYVAGEWIVYSYQDQGFSWLHPHVRDVLVSAKAGWFVYSPLMLLVIPGFFALRKQQPAIFPAILCICLLCLYITAAWDIWWYGGSLGQRALVQSYPLWAFTLAALTEWVIKKTGRIVLFGLFALSGIYLNLWWTHQAHRGGLFLPEQMNTPYVLNILGRLNVDRTEATKLLDVREAFTGSERKDILELAHADFEKDSVFMTTDRPISGTKSAVLSKNHEYVNAYSADVDLEQWRQYQWVRTSLRFRCEGREDVAWKMTQFTIRFWDQNDKVIKEQILRLQRHVQGNEEKQLFFDTRIPKKPFRKVQVFCWAAGSDFPVVIDDMQVELFKE